MRTHFDEQLAHLHQELISMGDLCMKAIGKSVQAMHEGDLALARSVPELSAQVDQKEREIEGLCLKLLLQQQPVATDLRTISSALKTITDMERIGDNSGDIAEIIVTTSLTGVDEAAAVHDMAQAVIRMVSDSIHAFVHRDVVQAWEVICGDDIVDEDFTRIKNALLQRLRTQDTDAEYALDLLMVIKYLERIGDHAVNIARWALFSETGIRGEEKG